MSRKTSGIETTPYSVYVNKRPLRIAFILNPNNYEPQQLDAILKYNMSKWGGRFNPIIFSDGKTIEEEWWEFLRLIDPDIIRSFVSLENELVERMEMFLSTFSIEAPREDDRSGSLDYSSIVYQVGLSILPLPVYITGISRSSIRTSKLVLFELENIEDPIIEQFIHYNFGTYSHTVYTDSALDQCEKEAFSITNKENLSSALCKLSDFERFTYPIQICALEDTFPDVTHDGAGDIFTVSVGNTVDDKVYSWNRSLLVPKWKRTDLNQVWLPPELAKDKEIEDSLRKWLNRQADPSGTTNQQIQFISFSLSQDELGKIADRLTRGTYLRKVIRILSKPQIPNFQPRPRDIHLKENTDLYRVTGDEELVELTEPNVLGRLGGEHWMADVFIQFRPERFKSFVGTDYWWCLPQKNRLAFNMFRTVSRIDASGFPSVLMKLGSPILKMKLPGDFTVFRSLITGETVYALKADPRNKVKSRPFDDIKRSDKGQYLSGFLDLFSGLPFAYQILEERYWRRMFNTLSGKNVLKDERKKEAIFNKVNKILKRRGSNFFERQEGLKWLSEYVLKISREQAVIGKELAYKYFVAEAKKELEEYNSSKLDNQKFEFDEQELKDVLFELLEANILLMGLRTRCPRCGKSNWHHIDDVKQTLRCTGCSYEHSVHPEQSWFYKLNTLVQVGCAYHGLVPIVLVLGQLLHESRSSFIMTTNLDLFQKGETRPFGELDIVCIKDGKFIIGEVKQSVDLFEKSDFEKMAKIAVRINPDLVLFSSLDPKPKKMITNNITEIKKNLKPFGIEVSWYQLHPFIFKASPVR